MWRRTPDGWGNGRRHKLAINFDHIQIVSRVGVRELSRTLNSMTPEEIAELLKHLDLGVLEKASTVFNDRKKPPGATGGKN